MRVVALCVLVLSGCTRRPAPASPRLLLPHQTDFSVANWGHNTWGYVDSLGNWVIDAQFETVGPFLEDAAVVSHAPQFWFLSIRPSYGFIKRSGEYLITPRFENARAFHGGLAAVQINKKWGFVDPSGRLAIPAQFDDVGEFGDWLAPAVTGGKGRNGDWGYIDKYGDWVIQPNLSGARAFSEDLAPAARGNVWGCIDLWTRKFAIEPRFAQVWEFQEGLAAAQEKGSSLRGYIDRSGAWKIPPRFGWALPFNHGRAVVQIPGDAKKHK